jgi:hypothetical protein
VNARAGTVAKILKGRAKARDFQKNDIKQWIEENLREVGT